MARQIEASFRAKRPAATWSGQGSRGNSSSGGGNGVPGWEATAGLDGVNQVSILLCLFLESDSSLEVEFFTQVELRF